jgi:CheY-like chemotaxis protein
LSTNPEEASPATSEFDADVPASGSTGKPAHVLLIDDSINDAEEAKFFLERSGDLEVDLGPVFPEIHDYSAIPLDASVAAVIVDQFLAEHTGVPYDGLDVAEYLRVIAPALPVFVLTNYAEDLEDQAAAVDLVITKGSMRKHAETYVARILRGIGRYYATLSARQLRLQQLIDSELSGELSDEGTQELSALRREIERPADLALQDAGKRYDDAVGRSEDRTKALYALISEMKALKQRSEG